ncbi:MAG TPA: enoyl-CoA hydratase/isomerase family protein [Natronosporangium sp.]
MADRLVEVETTADGGYAVLALNRPDKMNAVNVELADQLVDALDELSHVPVIVLTGRGRAFCAGVDLSQRSQVRRSWRAHLGTDRGQYWAAAVEAMYRHPAVFIAAVNGYALGGGLTLVNGCELAIASSRAEFGMPELGFGSVPALAGPTSAQRLLPKHVAELAFVSGRVDAGKALRWGLVNEVVPPEELLPRASELARQIAARDPVALAYTKRLLRRAREMDWAQGVEHGGLVAATVTATRDGLAQPAGAAESGD